MTIEALGGDVQRNTRIRDLRVAHGDGRRNISQPACDDLYAMGIRIVEDLEDMTRYELRMITRLGPTGLEALEEAAQIAGTPMERPLGPAMGLVTQCARTIHNKELALRDVMERRHPAEKLIAELFVEARKLQKHLRALNLEISR